jgi:hypothetical protein
VIDGIKRPTDCQLFNLGKGDRNSLVEHIVSMDVSNAGFSTAARIIGASGFEPTNKKKGDE